MTRMSTLASTAPSQPSSNQSTSTEGSSSIFRNLSSRLTSIGQGALDNLVANVKNFLPLQKEGVVTRLVATCMDPPASSTTGSGVGSKTSATGGSSTDGSLEVKKEVEEWLWLDCLPRRGGPASGAVGGGGSGRSTPTPSTRPPPGANISRREAIVFVVGGGSYVEYANLQEWVQRVNATPSSTGVGAGGGKKVLYGCTEMVGPREFVQVLSELK
jgi:sec1 family domain-containing protein 1